MKRSYMILRLMEILVEAPQDLEAAANDILNRLEKAGMSPPHRPVVVPNPNIKTDSDLAVLPALIVQDQQTWEPEDETF